MNYKRKKSFGGFGGGPRGGSYLPKRDPMNAYKQFSQREDEYHRKLKQSIERDELSGPGNFRDSHPNYKIMPVNIQENNLEKNSVDDIRESVFQQVMTKLKNENKEVTPELYERAQEQSEFVSDKLAENQEKTALDFTEELLSNSDSIQESNESSDFLPIMNEARQVIVHEKREEVDNAKTI